MNVERLHALMLALKSDLDGTGLLHRLYDLQKSLQEVIDHPEPHHQEGVGHALKAVHDAIESSNVDAFSPAWSALLGKMGFSEVLGSRLRSNLDASCQQSHVTPSLAKEEIQGRVNELERLHSIADRIAGALGEMGVGEEELTDEECEIGFTIPRSVVEGRLDLLIEELKEFEGMMQTFSEVATEERTHFEIGGLSSSDFAVHLKTPPVVAALFAAAMERVITVYQQLLEIRRLRTELTSQDVPGEVFDKLDAHVNRKMANAIEKIAIELVLEYYPSEDGKRARQLVVELGADLSKLANRIDRGYSVEVRTPKQPEPGEGGESANDLSLPPHFVVILRASQALGFLRLEAAPILELSEATSTRKAPPKKKPVTKKTVAVKKKAKRRSPAKKRAPAKKKTAPKKKAPAKKKKAPPKKKTATPPVPDAAPEVKSEEKASAPAPKKKARRKKRRRRAKKK